MLEEKEYVEIIKTLKSELKGSSDAVTITGHPYSHFLKADGTLDSRKGSFKVNIIIFTMTNAERMAEIFSDTFQRIARWMKMHSENIAFEYTIKTTANGVITFEFIVSFDKLTDVAITYLLKE